MADTAGTRGLVLCRYFSSAGLTMSNCSKIWKKEYFTCSLPLLRSPTHKPHLNVKLGWDAWNWQSKTWHKCAQSPCCNCPLVRKWIREWLIKRKRKFGEQRKWFHVCVREKEREREREREQKRWGGMSNKWTEATCWLLPFTVVLRAESQAYEFLWLCGWAMQGVLICVLRCMYESCTRFEMTWRKSMNRVQSSKMKWQAGLISPPECKTLSKTLSAGDGVIKVESVRPWATCAGDAHTALKREIHSFTHTGHMTWAAHSSPPCDLLQYLLIWTSSKGTLKGMDVLPQV